MDVQKQAQVILLIVIDTPLCTGFVSLSESVFHLRTGRFSLIMLMYMYIMFN